MRHHANSVLMISDKQALYSKTSDETIEEIWVVVHEVRRYCELFGMDEANAVFKNR